MTMLYPLAAGCRCLPLFYPNPTADLPAVSAGGICRTLAGGHTLDADLRSAMEAAFGGSDAAGAWDWKLAYEAAEAASVLFLRQFGPAMRAGAAIAVADAGDAVAARVATAVADQAVGGKPGVSAIFDTDPSRLCRRDRRRDD